MNQVASLTPELMLGAVEACANLTAQSIECSAIDQCAFCARQHVLCMAEGSHRCQTAYAEAGGSERSDQDQHCEVRDRVFRTKYPRDPASARRKA